MKRGNYTAGAMLASLAAGPAFVASLALTAWATSGPTTLQVDVSLESIPGLLGGVVAVTIVGFALSVIPNMLGSWFMHGVGIGNFAIRLPVPWALVGAGTAATPFAFISDPANPALPLSVAFALTGASCALVSHRFATWD